MLKDRKVRDDKGCSMCGLPIDKTLGYCDECIPIDGVERGDDWGLSEWGCLTFVVLFAVMLFGKLIAAVF